MRETIPDAVAEGIFMAGSGQPRGTHSNVFQLRGVFVYVNKFRNSIIKFWF